MMITWFVAGICIFSFLSFVASVLVLGAVMSNQRIRKDKDC